MRLRCIELEYSKLTPSQQGIPGNNRPNHDNDGDGSDRDSENDNNDDTDQMTTALLDDGNLLTAYPDVTWTP